MHKFITSLSTVAAISLAAIPVLGLTQSANAAGQQVRIAVSDLNLSSPTQAAVFKARVSTAADSLCRAKVRDNTLNMSFTDCRVSFQREVDRQLSNGQRKALQVAARAKSVEMAAQ